MNETFIPIAYLAASAAFILALKWLSSVPTAMRGVIVGAIGMTLAIGGTMLSPEIVTLTRTGINASGSPGRRAGSIQSSAK